MPDGYFHPDSILRRVHRERAVGLFYGQRALMIGALQPLNFVGTIAHTNGRRRPFARLVRTAKAFEAIFFGSRAEADRVLAHVHRMHEQVRGELAEQTGPFAAGTPYSAFDPELMLWTLAVIADSGPCFYELFVGELAPAEHEALWQEYVRFGELFGMPREVAPPTHREFRAWWEAKLAGEEMHLTEEARYIGHATGLEIPMPRTHAPAKRVHDLILLGSLPARVRELYGLHFTPGHAAAFRAAVGGLRAVRPLVPGRVLRGSCVESYDLVAATERRRIERGEPTPQIAT